MIAVIISAVMAVFSLQSGFDITKLANHSYSEQNNTEDDFNNSVQSVPAPVISFEKMEYDFGKMTFKGAPKSVKFKFTNKGNSPLVITRTELSCTCLSVEYPRKPVMPDEDGFFTVTYTPKKETGKFNNTVKIFSNSAERKPTIIFLRVEVTK